MILIITCGSSALADSNVIVSPLTVKSLVTVKFPAIVVFEVATLPIVTSTSSSASPDAIVNPGCISPS